ncbi:hypothetical protein SLEP1_g17063 [Rubroshorea leprosula]|uniref:Uncharacterized protein n=1 Tax=Rubroshorea leprosula TaxID=152421 RepID=A0AAV5J3G0_9ROSI|nr:hypothetical protein SLEP1_g17063 [Rubroshorea leprosula]
MGFIRRLFGSKKAANNPRPEKDRRRWSFTRSSNATSSKNNKPPVPADDGNLDANKHAIAVAAATAAVAEAALAAAHAAAEVVKLTSGGGGGSAGGGGGGGSHRRLAQEMAAVRIQSAFRGYLVSVVLFFLIFFSLLEKDMWTVASVENVKFCPRVNKRAHGIGPSRLSRCPQFFSLSNALGTTVSFYHSNII